MRRLGFLYLLVLEPIMEITRQPATGFSRCAEPAGTGKSPSATDKAVAAVSAPTSVKPGLEQIQSVLGQLPTLDLDKVASLKSALAAGELVTDTAALAAAMLVYHQSDSR